MAEAVVSLPARLVMEVSTLCMENREGTYIWTRVSDSASSFVRPCAMKDPNISHFRFASGLNRSSTTCLAKLLPVRAITQLLYMLNGTHPIIFPRPYESVFLGMRLFKKGDWKTFARNGNALTSIITGMVLSVVSMYAKTSSSFSMKPNGFPNAISPIKSKVRYWALRAKSTGLYSEPVERYLVSMSLIRLAIILSIDSSRSGFSFPAYCKKGQQRCSQNGYCRHTPGAIFARSAWCLSTFRSDKRLAWSGSILIASYQSDLRYGDRTASIFLRVSGSLVSNSLGPMRTSGPMIWG